MECESVRRMQNHWHAGKPGGEPPNEAPFRCVSVDNVVGFPSQKPVQADQTEPVQAVQTEPVQAVQTEPVQAVQAEPSEEVAGKFKHN